MTLAEWFDYQLFLALEAEAMEVELRLLTVRLRQGTARRVA